MRRLLIYLSILVLCLSMAAVSWATLILDTGQNPDSITGPFSLASDQWLTGQFTTTQAWNIGAMEGYIYTQSAGEVDVTIYSNTGNLPGTPLITRSFQSSDDFTTEWQGTTGFAGNLAAGSYWIAFTVPTSSTFYGGLGVADNPPPNPMSLEAYTNDQGVTWTNWPLNLGVRIEAAPVPVPPTVWLLGSGLLGLAGWRKFKKG